MRGARVGRVVFGWRPLREVLAEPNFLDMIRAHHEEAGVHKDTIPLDPDIPRYLQLEEIGIFRAWAGYSGKTLAAYMGWYVQPHLHYRGSLMAVEDLYYMSPAYRKGSAGRRMFVEVEDEFRPMGVKRIMLHCKTHVMRERGGLGPFFASLGYIHTDDFWSKTL